MSKKTAKTPPKQRDTTTVKSDPKPKDIGQSHDHQQTQQKETDKLDNE